jgi:hypothetical protein
MTSNQSQVFIYTRDLVPVAELVCRTQRSYVLNSPDTAFGQCTAFVPTTDTKLLNDETRRFGNLLIVRDQALGNWAGIIDEPQSYSTEEVSIHATSVESIFADRNGAGIGGGVGALDLDGPPGERFRGLVRHANFETPTGIAEGDIEDGQGSGSLADVGKLSILQLVRNLQDDTGYEWGVDPEISPRGEIAFNAWWKFQRGTDYSAKFELIEGTNVRFGDGPTMTLQGRVKNDIVVRGQAASDGSSAKSKLTVDLTSINAYGLRQYVVTDRHVSQTRVDQAADTLLAQLKNPTRTLDLVCVDSASYPYLRIGNTLAVKLTSVGFQNGQRGWQGNARIVGYAYDDVEGEVPLVLEGLWA